MRVENNNLREMLMKRLEALQAEAEEIGGLLGIKKRGRRPTPKKFRPNTRVGKFAALVAKRRGQTLSEAELIRLGTTGANLKSSTTQWAINQLRKRGILEGNTVVGKVE